MLTLFSVTLAAQDKVSESEVKIQETFIEAKKQKLLGNLDKALEIYQEMWRDHRDNHALAYEMSRTYVEQEEMSKALEFAGKAAALAPDNLWYAKHLADIYEKMGQHSDAAAVYEKIVNLTPEDLEAYNKWAFLLTKGEQIDEAIEVYDRAEQRFGISEELIRHKYTLYLGSGKEKKAEKELQRLVETFPKDPLYLEMLAGFYEQVDQPEEARKVYRSILKIDPENATAKMAIAGRSGADSDEIRFLESLEDVFAKEDVELSLKVERIQPLITKVQEKNDPDLARKILDLSTILEEAHSSKAGPFALSARMLAQLDRLEEAQAKYKQALELDDTQFTYWEELMQLQWEKRDYEALSNTSLDAMDIFPNQPICYYYNGVSLIRLEEYDGALSILDQALLMSESNAPLFQKIQLGIADAYIGLGDKSRAWSAFDASLKAGPDNPEVLSAYAYELARQKERLGPAREMAEKALKIQPDLAEAQQALAWVLYQSEDFKGAQKAMDKALAEGFVKNPEALEQYGDILFKLGDKEQALEYWNKAKSNGSTSKMLDKKISEKRLY